MFSDKHRAPKAGVCHQCAKWQRERGICKGEMAESCFYQKLASCTQVEEKWQGKDLRENMVDGRRVKCIPNCCQFVLQQQP